MLFCSAKAARTPNNRLQRTVRFAAAPLKREAVRPRLKMEERGSDNRLSP